MAVNLLTKYGIVPAEAMRDHYHAAHTDTCNRLLTRKLKAASDQLQTAMQAGADAATLMATKNAFLAEIYQLLVIFYGQPPTEFAWEWTTLCEQNHTTTKPTPRTPYVFADLSQTYTTVPNLTPLSFYQQYVQPCLPTGIAAPQKTKVSTTNTKPVISPTTPIPDITDYISIVHAPQSSKPFSQIYQVEHFNNVVEGLPITHYNIPLPWLKYLVLQALLQGEPVFFGCDVS